MFTLEVVLGGMKLHHVKKVGKWVKHKELAEFCERVSERGGFFLQSNSDTPFIRELYRNFHIEEVSALRSVSRIGTQRGRVGELLISNYGSLEGLGIDTTVLGLMSSTANLDSSVSV